MSISSDLQKSKSQPHIEWSNDHETILVEWADKAMCYRWLHSRAHGMYTRLNTAYTIPVIIISTLTGTANFAQDRVPVAYQAFFVMIVGGFNLLAGIISTIQQFLKVTQLTEAHRVSSIAWDKFYRNTKIELAKHPDERIPVLQMLKTAKEEFDRLMETSPTIPDKILTEFKGKFAAKFEELEDHERVVEPEICDDLVSTKKSINKWNTPEAIEAGLTKFNDELQQDMQDGRDKHHEHISMIRAFKKEFMRMNSREPTKGEIMTNLKQEIEEDVMERMFHQNAIEDIVVEKTE